MVEPQPSKLVMRVRFPSLALFLLGASDFPPLYDDDVHACRLYRPDIDKFISGCGRLSKAILH